RNVPEPAVLECEITDRRPLLCIHLLPVTRHGERVFAADEVVPDRNVLVPRKERLLVSGDDCRRASRSLRDETTASLATVTQRKTSKIALAAYFQHRSALKDIDTAVGCVTQEDVVELGSVDVNRPSWHAVALGRLEVEHGGEGRISPDVVAAWLHHPTLRGQYLGERATLL